MRASLVPFEWVKLELLPGAFNASLFEGVVEAVKESGIVLTTLAQLGNTVTQQRHMFELNRVCAADIPERGEFHTWDQYVERRIEVPSFDPEGVVVALDDHRWVGMSATSYRGGNSYAFGDMTGVLRSHRGHQLALAMKVRGMAWATADGTRTVRTVHHPANAPIIALNRRLGYTDASWLYP